MTHGPATPTSSQTMRRIAAGTAQADEVDDLIAELRDTHRRRPRLRQEFDRAALP